MDNEDGKTCAQRIESHLESCLHHIGLIYSALDGDLHDFTEDEKELEEYGEKDTEELYDELSEFPLSAEITHTFIVQLSTGGPGDQFECEVSKGKYGWEIDEIRYRFMDWWDGDVVRLLGEEFELAKRFCGYFLETQSGGRDE